MSTAIVSAHLAVFQVYVTIIMVPRPCSHCNAGTVIRHKFVPAQLCRHIGVRSH